MEFESRIAVPFILRDAKSNILNIIMFFISPLNAARSNSAKTIEKNCERSESTRRIKRKIISEV